MLRSTSATAPTLPPRPAKSAGLGQMAALLLATFVAYIPAMQAGYIWDDDLWVTGNPSLRTVSGLHDIWFDLSKVPEYYPLTLSSFWIEYQIWGLHPLGYHVNNVLLHAINALVLWRLLSRLEVPGAWLAAAIFAVHPVHVESVAWVTERKNVLMTLLSLLSVAAFVHYYPLAPRSGDGRPSHYVASLGAYIAAVLAKTVAVTLAPLLLVLIWWKRGRLNRRDILLVLPFFVSGLALGLVAVWMQKYHTGAAGAEFELTLAQRVLIAGRSLWFYAGKLLWPGELSFIYTRWDVDGRQWWQWIYPAAAVIVVAMLWAARHRLGRAPLAAVLWFILSLAPALGFFNIYWHRYSFVADHVQYVGSIGLITLAAATLATLARRRTDLRRYGPVAAGVLLLAMAAQVWARSSIYFNHQTLWSDTLEKNPTAWIGHTNLAVAVAPHDPETALHHYREAVRLKHDLHEAWFDMGLLLHALGRFDQAADAQRQAVDHKPQFADAHVALAAALRRQGKLDEALAEYELAVRLDSTLWPARDQLATLLLEMNREDEALAHYLRIAQLRPDLPAPRVAAGEILLRQGKPNEAATQFREALRLKPDLARAAEGLAKTQRR